MERAAGEHGAMSADRMAARAAAGARRRVRDWLRASLLLCLVDRFGVVVTRRRCAVARGCQQRDGREVEHARIADVRRPAVGVAGPEATVGPIANDVARHWWSAPVARITSS